MSSTSEAPDVECPACGHKFHESSYFEMGEGSELTCPKCGAELAVSEVETIMMWSITTKAEYEEEQRQRARARAWAAGGWP